MSDRMRSAALAWVTGAWLASLQLGYWLLLEIHVTASYLIYFTMVACWLAGTLIGLRRPAREERGWLIAAQLAFLGVALALSVSAHLAVAGLALAGAMAGGIAAGQFFLAQRGRFEHCAGLFAWENTGFLVGWIIGIVGWLLAGQRALLGLPLGWSAGMLMLRMRTNKERSCPRGK